jgi:hypothetical protein
MAVVEHGKVWAVVRVVTSHCLRYVPSHSIIKNE